MGNGSAEETHGDASFGFVHLSDIHFAGYGPEVVFDINSDIRRELVHDLQELVGRAGSLDAILIGGDIAGRGEEEEYKAAARWIDQLCEEFSVPPEMVFCVPGNHDVCRTAIESDSIFRVSQRALLGCSLEELDPLLESLFTNKEHPGLLLRGLAHYNEFAARFRCGMDLNKHRWEWNLEFGDLKIHLVGLASAILCGPDDVKRADQSRLAIGPQARIPRFVDDTVTIMLCHHPPNWLRDYDIVAPFLDRAHLQLYGHEHSFEMKASGAGWRIDAGAVHPSRKEDLWQPSYNLISLHRENTGDEVVVEIYPRRLLDDQTFGAMEEGEEFRRETIPVTYEPPADVPPLPASAPPAADSIEERQVARRFLDLDKDKRLRIGRDLGLIGDAEEALPEGVRMRHVFDRARAEGRLPELKEKIDD
jgi:predicted MPP superfamily phosphohydrolase